MFNEQPLTFQKALDIVESLPEYQQEDLVEIIRRRITEHRRESIAEDIPTTTLRKI